MPQCNIIQKQTLYELDKTGLWGEAVRQRKAIITNDYVAPNLHKKGYPEGHVPLVRHMNLPIFKKGRIVAVIGVGNKPTDYTDEDVRHLELFMSAVWNLVERKKAEDELLVAKELAEQSSKMKTELLANLSHELRTPLNGVIGGIQLLRFTELSEEQDEFLGLVEEAAANELTLVNNLLELVKLEADGIQLEHAPFSLHQCIKEVVQVHEWTATSKGIVLQTQLPVDLPTQLMGDKVRIRQILNSLLGNAVKFTAKGCVTLSFSFTKEEDQQIKVCFSVADTGIGIEPEKLERIFEQFIQSDMSNTRAFGGLGLGLTICQRLASVMGGQIRVESRLGEGSTFVLELPLELPTAALPSTAGKQSLYILLHYCPVNSESTAITVCVL
jgi:signal transduction histidine kinase